VARWTISLDFADIGAASPNFANHVSAVVFDPSVRARQRMQESPLMNFPSAKIEIEIMLAIVCLSRFL
jgi:hypothetical protein